MSMLALWDYVRCPAPAVCGCRPRNTPVLHASILRCCLTGCSRSDTALCYRWVLQPTAETSMSACSDNVLINVLVLVCRCVPAAGSVHVCLCLLCCSVLVMYCLLASHCGCRCLRQCCDDEGEHEEEGETSQRLTEEGTMTRVHCKYVPTSLLISLINVWLFCMICPWSQLYSLAFSQYIKLH